MEVGECRRRRQEDEKKPKKEKEECYVLRSSSTFNTPEEAKPEALTVLDLL